MAKKPTGGLTRGGEEKYEKKWQKNQPEDLQVVKRRKFEVKNDKKTLLGDLPGGKRRKLRVKMAEKPTGGLTRGGRGEEEEIGYKWQKNIPGGRRTKYPYKPDLGLIAPQPYKLNLGLSPPPPINQR